MKKQNSKKQVTPLQIEVNNLSDVTLLYDADDAALYGSVADNELEVTIKETNADE